jgi:hypothetical protein
VKNFWSKVEKTPACWIWKGHVSGKGYGRLGNQLAHRISYKLHFGSIPSGLCIDHICRNRSCVRPDHLEAVSYKENLLRGQSEAALKAHKAICKHGHPLSGDNLYLKKNGCRECRTCNRLRDQKKNLARKLKTKPL